VEQLLSTKLYIPRSRPKLVTRPRLIQQLNEGLHASHTAGVTLISAPAGFGKTTLLSEWVNDLGFATDNFRLDAKESKIANQKSKIVNQVAWLSLDEGDNDPARFLAYLITALQKIGAKIEDGVLASLQSPQPPPMGPILTSLLNELTAIPDNFILVLDDYHVIDSKSVDKVLTFLLEHQPPQMHLVIATREDPPLPLARLRAHGQLTELRAADLRFTLIESAHFLNQVMSLQLSAENVAALETRTEGWIAGLQLAALSMQGQKDTTDFIKSFTGSHHFVMDYLVEEVLQQQPESIQTFLLRTSILDRLCGPLCEAVLLDASISGQGTLEHLERANLFIIPLDNERRWYRYHHLFADLLRQRLHHSIASSKEDAKRGVSELHIRASQWYEDNDLPLEAFHHAAAANDIERAERIIDGRGIPLHFSGGVVPIIDWLASLPASVKNARPSLWWRHAAMLLINGQTAGVEENLQAAETALAAILQGAEPDDQTRNLVGLIAMASATLALTRYDVKAMLAQSHRALEYLDPNRLFQRANANWTLGYAYILQGDRALARQAFTESITLGQAAGAMFPLILATIGLGYVQELDNELYQAAETYQRVLQWAGDKPQQIIGEAHLGLARVLYEWNELESAEQHAGQSLHLARQYESFIDRFVIAQVFLVRLKLAQGDVAGAAAILSEADQSVRQYNFVLRMPEVAAVQVLTLLRQGNLAAAAHAAETHQLPLSQARVHIAQGNPSAALAVLEPFRQQVEAQGWKDEQLKAIVLQAVAFHAHGETDKAVQVLNEALVLAEPGGFIRLVVDEGLPMAQLLSKAATQGIMPSYVAKLLAAFESEKQAQPQATLVQPLVEPLSQRELEVLQLIAQGLSNDEIGKRLFLALDTVKGHNRRIYDKLQVQRRTEAVARARELGLL
jgi:LuxR family transcriptional regulator, maltose regulon positive regulatory protein